MKQLKLLRQDLDRVNEQLRDAEQEKEAAVHQLTRSHSEMIHWKTSCEYELIQKEDDLETEK